MTLAPSARATIRVASVPSSHVYVRHLAVDGTEDVVRLPDPRPRDAGPAAARWWPPRMLEAQWVQDEREAFDLYHVHFGFDARSVEQLDELVQTLRRHGRPLVLTVHDLRNPHQRDRAAHDAQLDVLVPAADDVITLTPGAAREVEERWHRSATVLPHPHVLEPEDMARWQERHAARPRDTFRVGLHAKSLRPSMDPAAIVPALAEAVREVPGGVLQLDMHTDVADPTGRHHHPALLEAARRESDVVELHVHDYFSDDELWAYLAGIDVSVLPYRFGTHSGWLEACRDVGTAVVAPTCGYYAEQGPVESYVMDETAYDPDSLVEAVRRARLAPPPPVSVAERQRQRHEVAVAHQAIYSEVLGR
ncbi:hypothetical protein ASD11_09825 [Aeromicrobium sp. Root495]|uniref:glycosyltransferase n=1 Tax=Aeromicrobium sp. Root495 TaxID=1736550 RepID=UPI0006F9092F|nr:glycosyltransferase [Aeromicrobium sp. Root495]KQY59816.1 hypothetical protein ASD11_09825 [Aeromicrobium sp. Root495]